MKRSIGLGLAGATLLAGCNAPELTSQASPVDTPSPACIPAWTNVFSESYGVRLTEPGKWKNTDPAEAAAIHSAATKAYANAKTVGTYAMGQVTLWRLPTQDEATIAVSVEVAKATAETWKEEIRVSGNEAGDMTPGMAQLLPGMATPPKPVSQEVGQMTLEVFVGHGCEV